MIKWVIELSEYDISYQPKSTIKAQALAEFVNEATLVEDDEGNWLLHTDGSSTLAGNKSEWCSLARRGTNWNMLGVLTSKPQIMRPNMRAYCMYADGFRCRS
ncbi:UNVERIFIED_CONTAM: hypothetical protein Sangu_0485000 [Sesamum angustifolium]|uniref:Uncharacterized protein n=1 Tax=Sesamum angustifolium TaxID=2727405 RepID=A0AAW2Q7X9_9LAMI